MDLFSSYVSLYRKVSLGLMITVVFSFSWLNLICIRILALYTHLGVVVFLETKYIYKKYIRKH